jgi:PhzF family phenazine biosynthesis protein
MEIPLYQVDAFTEHVFYGNPAAVCPLAGWLPEDTMQAIALENNLPETAFLVEDADAYRLRWFTPAVEVQLCGHATLAAAHVVFTRLHPDWREVTFHSPSGPLTCRRRGDRLQLDFPALSWETIEPSAVPTALLAGLAPASAVEVVGSIDYIVVLADEQDLRSLQPDLSRLSELDLRGVVVTAPSRAADFCSRFFGPKLGIPEDPITGSAHCALVPYWADRLGREGLQAVQYSTRLGAERAIRVNCQHRGSRVLLDGSARLYLEGLIHLDEAELPVLDDPRLRS